MRPMWLIALAVILALVVAGSVAASPKRPSYGDPDIVEGSRPKVSTPREHTTMLTRVQIFVDLPFFGPIVWVRQGQRAAQDNVPGKLSAASERDLIWR